MKECFYEQFLVNESTLPLIDLCNQNPHYSGLIVFSYFDHQEDFGYWFKEQDVNVVNEVHHKTGFEDCYYFDNGSKLYVMVCCDNFCGHRVNGIAYHASLKRHIVDSVFRPMLTEYSNKSDE